MQCSHFAFVCVYIYIIIYICHTLITWVQFLLSRPQTTNHVVQRRSMCAKDRARAKMEQCTGLTKRRSTFEKDRARAKMEQEQSKRDRASENRNKGTLHQKRVRQRRKSLTDCDFYRESLVETSRTNIYSLRDSSDDCFAIFTAIPRPRHLAPTDIYLHISGYSSVRGILCACVFLVYQSFIP